MFRFLNSEIFNFSKASAGFFLKKVSYIKKLKVKYCKRLSVLTF